MHIPKLCSVAQVSKHTMQEDGANVCTCFPLCFIHRKKETAMSRPSTSQHMLTHSQHPLLMLSSIFNGDLVVSLFWITQLTVAAA